MKQNYKEFIIIPYTLEIVKYIQIEALLTLIMDRKAELIRPVL